MHLDLLAGSYIKLLQVHGVVVASNWQVRVVFHMKLGFKYKNLIKCINLGYTKGEGKKE